MKNDDFTLAGGSQSYTPVLLAGGNQLRPDELVIQGLALRRAPDGSIEYSDAGSGDGDDKPSLGDLVRGVKGAHRAASIGGERGRRGILDWVPGPLEERSGIIQPPGLSGYVWRAQRTQNIQDAWRAADIACLFPLPPPGTNAKLVVFGDNSHAISIAVQ